MNTIVGGKLADLLAEWREEGDGQLTYRQIADKLRAEYHADVSIETVRRWCLAEPEVAAS